MKPIQLIPQTAVDRLLAGDAEILFAAFNHGLTVDIRWPHWHYPLLHGLAHACPDRVGEMIEAVLEKGADPLEECNGLTPAILAIGGWHPEGPGQERRLSCLERILQAGGNASDPVLLQAASACGYAGAVRLLLSMGADPNSVDQNGQTPLHLAFSNEQAAAAKALVGGGADMNATDREGMTPRDLMLSRYGTADSQWLAKVGDFCLEVQTPMPANQGRAVPRL